MLKYHIELSDLMDFIKTVPSYPISAEQLSQLAKKQKTDPAVVDFYDAFPAEEVFINREDLVARTEQIEILNREPQPFEAWVDEN